MPKPVPEMSVWFILIHSMDPIYWMHHRTWVFFPKKTSKWRYLLVMGFRTIQQIGTSVTSCDMGFIDLWHGQHCQHSSADITDITFPFLKVTIRFGHPVSKVTIRHPSRFAYVSLTPLRQAAALVSHRLQGEKRRRHGGSKAWRFPFGHDEWYFFITYSILPTYDVNLSVFFFYDVNFVIYHHVFCLFVMYLVNVLSFMSICHY